MAMTRAWHQNVKRAPAVERTVDGVVFDSKSEARRWAELKLMERAGEIADLRRQVVMPLVIFEGPTRGPIKIRSKGFPQGRPCVYTADFSYLVRGARVLEEHKGHDTAEARLRRAVVEAIYGIEIVVTGPAAKNTPRRRSRRRGPEPDTIEPYDAGADARASYDEAVREIGKRVKAGAPVPAFFLSEKGQ